MWKAFIVTLKEVGRRGPGESTLGLNKGVVGTQAPLTHKFSRRSLIFNRSEGSTVNRPVKNTVVNITIHKQQSSHESCFLKAKDTVACRAQKHAGNVVVQ